MKLYAPLAIALLTAPFLAAPVLAQTATDGAPLSSRIGPVFYSDDSMATLRTADEIKTGWDSLSADDQGNLRARCQAIGVNFQADMTESSGDAGSGVEPSAGADAPAVSAGTDQEPTTESGGDAGAGVQPTEGTDAGVTADAPQAPTDESTGDAGSGVEPTEEAANEGFMADEAKLREVCDAAAEL
jgi:hypothetical protein